jgi:hypothetical protein
MKTQPRTINPKPKVKPQDVASPTMKEVALQNALGKNRTTPAWRRAASRLQPKQRKPQSG